MDYLRFEFSWPGRLTLGFTACAPVREPFVDSYVELELHYDCEIWDQRRELLEEVLRLPNELMKKCVFSLLPFFLIPYFLSQL